MVPEWLAVSAMIFSWFWGFATAAMVYSKSPFWRGFGDGLSLRFIWDRRPSRPEATE